EANVIRSQRRQRAAQLRRRSQPRDRSGRRARGELDVNVSRDALCQERVAPGTRRKLGTALRQLDGFAAMAKARSNSRELCDQCGIFGLPSELGFQFLTSEAI